MKEIEKFLTPFIQEQFPSFYREEGELFIAFTKQYYRWMEDNFQELILETPANFLVGDIVSQDTTTGTIVAIYDDLYLVQVDDPGTSSKFRCTTDCAELTPLESSSGGSSLVLLERSYNVLFHSRRLPDYRDIDRTIEQFILQFKDKYLSDIQFTTATNKELFIKNSLDFYRSKGSERAIDLYFKLVYGFPARVYYPGDDVFKLSDNTFDEQVFLEVFDDPGTNRVFVDQIVEGTISGATAYVERFVRYKRGSRFFSILYLDNLEGDFQTGEQIVATVLDTTFTTKVIGSPTSLTILSSEPGFEIGNDLTAVTGTGYDSTVRVTATETKTGVVDFELLDGGWGFTAGAQVLASNAIFRTAGITFANTHYFSQNYFIEPFDTIRQDLLLLDIDGDANTITDYTDNVVTVYNGANVEFQGLVVSYAPGATTSEALLVVNYDSFLYAASSANGTLYSAANVASGTIANNNNISASANVIGQEHTFTIEYSSNTNMTVSAGDIIKQEINVGSVDVCYANGTVANTFFVGANPITRKYYANVRGTLGSFRSNRPFIRQTDSEEFTTVAMSNVQFGVITPVNTFYAGANTYTDRTGTYFEFQRQFGYSVQANIIFSTILGNPETLTNVWNDTLIQDIDGATLLNVVTMDVEYANGGIEKTLSLGMGDLISELPHAGNNNGGFADITIGEVTAIVVKNPGDGYSQDPMYVIYEPSSYHLDLHDYEFDYRVISGNNNIATPITLNIGELVSANNGALARITEYDRSNTKFKANRLSSTDFVPGDQIYSAETNRTLFLHGIRETRRENYSRSGFNAHVSADALSGSGFITSVDIINSGFGYYEGEQVEYQFGDLSLQSIIHLGKQGKKEGTFLDRKGFLSSDKYLHDNDYYQQYSYNVITTLPFEEYKDTLIKILHVAGTKPFGSYFGSAKAQVNITTPINFETTTTTTS